MSENVIFCFSGTGNCLDIAKNIAACVLSKWSGIIPVCGIIVLK